MKAPYLALFEVILAQARIHGNFLFVSTYKWILACARMTNRGRNDKGISSRKSIFALMISIPLPLSSHQLALSCPHGEILFQVELAQTPEECQKGLMFRTDLADDEGMLFLFPHPKTSSMWMKNTPLPLDMIFCGENGKILALHENAVPFSLTSIGPVKNTAQVLEIKGGMIQKHGITEKCRLRLH